MQWWKCLQFVGIISSWVKLKAWYKIAKRKIQRLNCDVNKLVVFEERNFQKGMLENIPVIARGSNKLFSQIKESIRFLFYVMLLLGSAFWTLFSLAGFGRVSCQTYTGNDNGKGGLVLGNTVLNVRFPIATTNADFLCATIDWWPPKKCDYNTCSWALASLLNLYNPTGDEDVTGARR